MIRISLERASASDRLAKPVFDTDGKMLLNSGVQLNQGYLARLSQHGVMEVYIESPQAQGVVAEDAVSDASRIECTACAHACMLAATDHLALPAARVLEAIEGMCDDVRRVRGRKVAVSPARSPSDWWEAHARNVALLSVATARELGLGGSEVPQLVVGALLHDIGLVGLSAEPLCTPQQETDGKGQAHAVLGFQTMMMNPEMSARSAVVCLQHHERRDGSGFPKRLTGDDIALAAQVCAVADAYDLLIAPGPFGAAVMPHVALGEVRGQTALAQSGVLEAFQRAVSPYPSGTALRLGDGSTAVVFEAPAPGASALQVRVISRNGNGGMMDLDLADGAGAAVRQVL